MPISITSTLAIYFVLWWIVLFVTLPFGVQSQGGGPDHVAGTDPGAPILTRMRGKLIWTTIISLVLFAMGVFAYSRGWLNIERLTRLLGFPF